MATNGWRCLSECGLESLPSCYHGEVCTREREPGRGSARSLSTGNTNKDIALITPEGGTRAIVLGVGMLLGQNYYFL